MTNTKIFARADGVERQFLVYSMTVEAKDELAMVLPLPVKPGSGPNALRFIDLHEYPDFFSELSAGFPIPPANRTKGVQKLLLSRRIEVVTVGSFDASFVPSIADFSRLDPRFQLPAGTWDQLPAYKSYGFAVFKLKPDAKVKHPMAFSFARADPAKVFFPTVHIHDGKVHPKAQFDHELFHQGVGAVGPALWDETPDLASKFMQIQKTQGIIAPDQHCYRQRLTGSLPNQDTIV